MSERRIAMIRQRLEAALEPEVLEIHDESHLHAGHAGARSGKGHFKVRIRSNRFVGVPARQRHQLVYAALGELMETEIHALSLQAEVPESSTVTLT